MENLNTNQVKAVGNIAEISDYTDWGLIDFFVPKLWAALNNRGDGVKIAVLDSGVDAHKDLEGSINYNLAFDAINNSSVQDKSGHGTGVIGVIAAKDTGFGIVGVAPRSEVIPIKILGDNNSVPSIDCLERAFQYILKIKPDIVNMSFGGKNPLPPACEKYLQDMYDLDIPVVCAAGNNGENFDSYPANYNTTISVTSYDKSRNVSSFSSRSLHADFALPGEDILTTHLNNKYATVKGTSYSTPFLCGVIALILSKMKTEKKNFDLEALKKILIASSEDYGPEGKDSMYGYGIICAQKLIASI
jgi:minor extracellular protease Epr